MKSTIQQLCTNSIPYVKSCYRHLHAHPELSFNEFETSKFIQQELTNNHIQFRAGIAKTGIMGIIEGRNPSKRTIALRADIDALPINEETNIDWKSANKNVMHACGHDAHTACLLGAAKILNGLKNTFEGRILIIFQPGEEKAPGGARLMLKDGVFDTYQPDVMIAQHVSVDYPTGTMNFLAGKINASADEIHVTIRGKGGHGALPHLCNDTVLAASQIIISLQQIRSRLCHPLTPMVLTFGCIAGGTAQNIIPEEVNFSGTLRTLDEAWRNEAKKHIVRIITETADAYGCSAEISIPDGYPCVINDAVITQHASNFAQEWVGAKQVNELEVRMTGEDFSFFSQQYPSTFYRFGIKGQSNWNTGGLHSPTFCIDEEALATGMGGLTWLTWRFLSLEKI